MVLKDVSIRTLNDLITFIYHGDVKIKRENLEDFFKTAKLLKIKGLANAESLLSNTFSSSIPHTASQFQSINTIHVQSPEKVLSSDNSQCTQPINNNLHVDNHANATVQIKTEKHDDDHQLITNGLKDNGGNKESNHIDKTVKQSQRLAVKRKRPSQTFSPKAKRTNQLNRNGN